MNALRCLIVDDEELARRLIRSYCARLPHLLVVGEAANSVEALRLLREQEVDLLLLDIQMPEMTGLDLLKALRQPPAVILTTAYADYALESYEFDVVDYLLKPFPFERFVRAVEKVTVTTPPGTSPAPRDPAPVTYQLVRSEHKVYRIAHADIRYVESMREYVAYHTAEGRTLALGSLKQLEQELPENFLRVHKSYIVARDRVTALEGNMLHLGSERIPIGGSYREEVKRKLFR